MLVSVSVSVPRLAVSVARLRSTVTLVEPPKKTRSMPPPPLSLSLPARRRADRSRAAVQRVVAAEALEVVVAAQP